MGQNVKLEVEEIYRLKNWLKFIVFSLIGCILYFIPVNFKGSNSIPIDQLY